MPLPVADSCCSRMPLQSLHPVLWLASCRINFLSHYQIGTHNIKAKIKHDLFIDIELFCYRKLERNTLYLHCMSKMSKLSLFDFTMIVVSLLSVWVFFEHPLNVAKAVPYIVYFFCSLDCRWPDCFLRCTTYAEIGSRLPVTGATIKFFLRLSSFHRVCYQLLILVSNAASWLR